MANTKISALPAAPNLTSAELAIAQGGVTKKVTTAVLNTHIQTILASETNIGLVELGTVAEVSAGISTSVVMTPDAYRKATPYYVVRGTGSYALSLTDRNTDQWCTAVLTCSIPTEASVAFAIGDSIPFLRLTSSDVTIYAPSGVTLNGVTSVSGVTCTIRTQYQGALLKKIGSNAWVISGDVSTVA